MRLLVRADECEHGDTSRYQRESDVEIVKRLFCRRTGGHFHIHDGSVAAPGIVRSVLPGINGIDGAGDQESIKAAARARRRRPPTPMAASRRSDPGAQRTAR
jgi:hypothetical protein